MFSKSRRVGGRSGGRTCGRRDGQPARSGEVLRDQTSTWFIEGVHQGGSSPVRVSMLDLLHKVDYGRSTFAGFARAARRAGIRQAPSAAPASANIARAKLVASIASTR